MAELDRDLNNQVARARLQRVLDHSAPITIHSGGADAGAISPWLRRALGAMALTVAGAAAGAQIPQEKLRDMAEAKNLPPVKVMIAGKAYEATHPMERIRLCKEIASEQRLNLHGMDWRDIYAVVQAETGWASRDGMGLNGKPSFGLAQMEEATAKSLGINPGDPREALVGVSRLLKEAAAWAKAKGADKKMALSVYYNLSTKARNAWDGVSADDLPVPTQNHIRNLRDGHRIATSLAPKYEKFVLAAQKAVHSQNAIREDLDQQRTHIAKIPVMGFEGMDVEGARLRVSEMLARRHAAPSDDHSQALASAGGMSVQMRMLGFPGSALRPSEDMARRTRAQTVASLRSLGLDRLMDSLGVMGRSASDVVAAAKTRLMSAPALIAKSPLSIEFPTIARAVAAVGSNLESFVQSRSAEDLAQADGPEQSKARASTLNIRLSGGSASERLLDDVQIAAQAPAALRGQQLQLSDMLQRIASEATSSSVRFALNEQGRMVAFAASRDHRERHLSA